MVVGDPSRPLDIGEKKWSWCHLNCVNDDDVRLPVCKHICKSDGSNKCIYYENGGNQGCSFRHLRPDEGVEALQLGVVKTFKRYHGNGIRVRRRIANEGRAAALRRWLVSVIGIDYLQTGFIIDVAGGKGELSFELENLNNLRCVVWDPRPLKLTRYARKHRFGFYTANEILNKYNVGCKDKDEAPSLPLHMRSFFEVPLLALDCYKSSPIDYNCRPVILEDEELFQKGLLKGYATEWTPKGFKHEDDDQFDDNAVDDDIIDDIEIDDIESRKCSGCEYAGVHRDITDLEEARTILNSCSCIVGLHPDQGAEHILRYAISNNKPCAIIPCCVYSKSFPKRRSASGELVTSYSDLVQYLLSLSPNVHATQLDFEGKNVLVYFLPDSIQPLRDPNTKEPLICKGNDNIMQHVYSLSKNQTIPDVI